MNVDLLRSRGEFEMQQAHEDRNAEEVMMLWSELASLFVYIRMFADANFSNLKASVWFKQSSCQIVQQHLKPPHPPQHTPFQYWENFYNFPKPNNHTYVTQRLASCAAVKKVSSCNFHSLHNYFHHFSWVQHHECLWGMWERKYAPLSPFIQSIVSRLSL